MLRVFKKLIAWLGKNRKGQTQNPSPPLDSIATKRPEEIHFHWHFNDMVQSPASVVWNVLPTLLPQPVASVAAVDVAKPVYDEHLLDRARTQWQFGDWESLAALSREEIEGHPERAKLALLAAAGRLQTGQETEARQFIRLAQDWGCSKKLISQILIAGVHNSMGRAAAISGQEQRAISHFETSITVAMPQSDFRLLGQTRIIRETTKLGLLPQAARLMGEELSVMQRTPALDSSRLKIFETELELLHGELSLAQQRQQLFHHLSAEINSTTTEGPLAWIEALKKKSVSQLGQDLWVLEKTGYKRNGYFVEFGATDGVLLSNTWLLETEFGWKGICAEPNPKFFAKLKTNRQCTVSEQCISGKTGKRVEFVFADAYGGSQEYANEDMHGEKRAAYRAAGHVVNLSTISLNDFLEQHDAPHEIDYLSIDTEGSEFEILQAFPFDKWRIRLLTIEHNYTARRADIRALMELHGYRCIEQQWDDWYYKPDWSFIEKAQLSKRNIAIPKAAACDFKGRFVEVMAAPLNQWTPLHPLAGQITDNEVVLHNDHRVPVSGKHAYYDTYSDILIFNRGVHEPLEEFCFQEIIKYLPDNPVMLELGAFWGHYSMWLKQVRPDAAVHLVESEADNLEAGKINFAQNGYEGIFMQEFIGHEGFKVDQYLQAQNIKKLDILHADIQGFELEMLEDAKKSLEQKIIDYVFLSTHSQELHAKCSDFLEAMDYKILVSSDFDNETTSYDGFLLAVSALRC